MGQHPYILGSGDDELDRLASQHDVWRATTERLWSAAGFGAGQRILDLGCGPGFTSFALAERVGQRGRIIAMDNSERFIEVLQAWIRERKTRNIEAVQGDAYNPGLKAGSLDGIFVRWLLCFLPETQRIIHKAAKMLAPGGHLAVMDYFHYRSIQCFPASELFTHVFAKIFLSFADAGGDLDVGGKLPQLMHNAGLDIVHVEPIMVAAQPGSPVWQWVRTFQKGYLPKLVEKGYLSAQEVAANDLEWRNRAEDPASFFLSPPMLGVVAKKRA